MNNFHLMILAAGYGKRMKSLTQMTPKPLLIIKKKELLSHTIDFFISLGCGKIVINTHYLHNKINDFIIKNYHNKNIELIFESSLLNTGGGIKNALEILENRNFLVTNSDILWDNNNKTDIINFIDKYELVKTCKLLLSKNDNFEGLKKSKGDFILEKNLIKRWCNNEPSLYYSGLQIINPVIFQNFNNKCFSINGVWDFLIAKMKLEGRIMNSVLYHIGDLSSYDRINEDLSLE